MKKIRKFKIKTYSAKTGKLIPISFNTKFPIKVKRIFFYMEKKIKPGGIMHTKNVPNFLLLYREKLSYISKL